MPKTVLLIAAMPELNRTPSSASSKRHSLATTASWFGVLKCRGYGMSSRPRYSNEDDVKIGVFTPRVAASWYVPL